MLGGSPSHELLPWARASAPLPKEGGGKDS